MMPNRPTIENVHHRDDLLGLSRLRARTTEQRTIEKRDLTEYEARGWAILRHNKNSIRLHRPKPKPKLLEDRVWSMLYKMGFAQMSGENGASLVFDERDPKSATQQIDVVAIDDEVAIGIECKSYKETRIDPKFTEKLSKHANIRGRFAQATASKLPS